MPVGRRKLAVDVPVSSQHPPHTISNRLLNVRQAAVYLGCSVWAIRDLIRRKQVPKIKLGKFLVDRGDLDGYIERMKAAVE